MMEDSVDTPHSWAEGNFNKDLFWYPKNIDNNLKFLGNVITCDEL